MPAAAPMTAAEYALAPFDGIHTELVAGEVIVQEPRPRHQNVLLRVVLALGAWVDGAPRRGKISLPLDVGIDDLNVFAPDLLWYAEGRAPADDAPWPFWLPDLAVEVRSPSTWRYDVGIKCSTYDRAGLPELWLVDTAVATVRVLRRSAPGAPAFDVAVDVGAPDVLTSPMLPGFGIAAADLFAA